MQLIVSPTHDNRRILNAASNGPSFLRFSTIAAKITTIKPSAELQILDARRLHEVPYPCFLGMLSCAHNTRKSPLEIPFLKPGLDHLARALRWPSVPLHDTGIRRGRCTRVRALPMCYARIILPCPFPLPRALKKRIHPHALLDGIPQRNPVLPRLRVESGADRRNGAA